MRKKELYTALLLLVALLAAVAVGLVMDRAASSTEPGVEPEKADLLITEVCAKNTEIIEDSRGKHSDYIEIYNRGEDCNLHGFTLSDGQNTSAPFGDTPLKAGGYLVLFIDRDLTGFALSSAGGENLFLYDRDGSTAAQITLSPMGENQVMEWQGTGYALTDRATPGFPNTEEGYLLFTQGMPDESPALVVSEFLLSNRYALPDKSGAFSDVLELHNQSGEVLSLGGYYLSDNGEDRYRYPLPAVTVPAGGYLVVYCDGRGVYEDGEIHANFALSDGETVFITSPAGKYTSATAKETPDDRSYALTEGTFGESDVSPGYPNTEGGVTAFLESRMDYGNPLVISEILLSGGDVPFGGVFTDVVELCNKGFETINTKGYYLSDGEDPYKYPLPEKILAPGECVLLICDGADEEWHANFALSKGETLRITCPDHRYGESVAVVVPEDGKSLVREEGAEGAAYRVGEVSLGYPNTVEGRASYLQANLGNTLWISEVVASNTESLPGSYGTTCDWVELYNPTDAPVSLEGWYLTDDPDELNMGKLPAETVQPGEYYVVFLSKDTENLRKGYPVVPFGLSSAGDRLYLSKEGMVADHVLVPALGANVSYGRAEGAMEFTVLASVTPNASNGMPAMVTEIPSAVTAQGVYNDVNSLSVVLEGEGEIYYTTDCTVPTVNSTRYVGPLTLTETTVVRAISVAPGKTASKVLDLTYIINEDHSLPVASLVTEPDNLWDYYEGIYVMGPGANPKPPHIGANFWQNWEREASVSLYELDGTGFSSPCGIRIFGGFSRQQDMKSLSCFFRSDYGAGQLSYPLFGEGGLDVYEAFVFRNTGQDYNGARMRDALLTDLASSAMYMPSQKNRPVVLYLNGEFWGVYYIREKINENYIAGNFNVSPETVTLDRGEGSTSAYKDFIKYVKKNDLSDPEVYANVASQMDIDQYIDYMIAQIYIANLDNVNVKFFKIDGQKWTWILFDVDYSTTFTSNNTVAAHLDPDGTGTNNYFSTDLINGLLENDGFRDKFLSRFAWQIENVWSYQRVNPVIDKYYNAILPEMERDCERWELSYSAWEKSVNRIRTFFENREGYVVEDLQDWFKLSDAQMEAYGFDLSA
ncbi:MAG: hypothetical protein E7651_08995 [Ruminococcaceae bacterium]|nr:hypothetical protein [Oscillospiraceae bacterium]